MTTLWPRIRLFGLLALLVPLFLGLQYLVQESVPQIEVRFIAPDAQSAAQPPAERIVERVVYVPVEKTETSSLREPASGPSQPTARGAEPVKLSGMDSTAVAAAPPVQAAPLQAGPEQAAAEPVHDEVADAPEPAQEAPVHIGIVAPVAPPVVVSAPPARAVAAQPRYVAPVVAAVPVEEEEPADEIAEEAVAEEPTEAAPEVAEVAPPAPTEQVAEITVHETMLDGSQTTRIVSYKIPVQPTPAIAQSTQEPAAAPEAAAEEPVSEEPVASEEAAPTEEAAAPADAVEAGEAGDPTESPVGLGDQSLATEEESVAQAEAVEDVAEDASEAIEAAAPADAELDESVAVDVAEIEEAAPTEPTVSSVSVTTVIVEQGQ